MEALATLLVIAGIIFLLVKYRKARWILGGLLASVMLAGGAGYYYYNVLPNRVVRLEELWDIKLGWPRDEVIFRKGEPKLITHEDGEERLQYIKEYSSSEHIVIIADDHVVGVYVFGGWASSAPFGLSGGIESIEEKLGPPQTVRRSDDSLRRTLIYPQYNLYLILKENRITGWGIRAR